MLDGYISLPSSLECLTSRHRLAACASGGARWELLGGISPLDIPVLLVILSYDGELAKILQTCPVFLIQY
jgi:hypothetical protein